MSNAFRITHHKDPVPHLPLESMGFNHLNTEVYYPENNKDPKICDDTGEDPTCSDQFAIDLNVLDHLTYLAYDFSLDVLACQ